MALRPELIEKGCELVLKGLGASLHDPNFRDTPERYAKALTEMFEAEDTDWATFEEKYTDFILLRNHKLYSLCPHHLLPVRFYVSLAYIPNGHVLGLSKLARLLHECNSGPLLQEAFTKQVLEKIYEICPGVMGAACLIEGTHGCLEMRGIRSDAHFVTYKLKGVFEENSGLEDRFFKLCTR
jgi:GTP cyclohydrolase I